MTKFHGIGPITPAGRENVETALKTTLARIEFGDINPDVCVIITIDNWKGDVAFDGGDFTMHINRVGLDRLETIGVMAMGESTMMRRII